jgi:hypothetical protein
MAPKAMSKSAINKMNKDLEAEGYDVADYDMDDCVEIEGKLYVVKGTEEKKHFEVYVADKDEILEVEEYKPSKEPAKEPASPKKSSKAKEPVKEPAKEQEPAKEPASPKKSSKAKEPVKEPAKEQDPQKEPASPKKSSKAKKPAKEPAKEPVDEAAKEPVKESSDDAAKDGPAAEAVEKPKRTKKTPKVDDQDEVPKVPKKRGRKPKNFDPNNPDKPKRHREATAYNQFIKTKMQQLKTEPYEYEGEGVNKHGVELTEQEKRFQVCVALWRKEKARLALGK